jgi:hypothetical protein
VTQLFKRCWRITVGDTSGGPSAIAITDSDVEFTVKKTLKPEPNTCEIKLYNLTHAHQKQMEQNPAVLTLQKVPVKLEAGLDGVLTQFFLGELRAGFTVNEGAEVITQLSTGSGEKELQQARMNVPLGPGTSIQQALQELVSTLGIGNGNIAQAAAQLQTNGQATFSSKGVVLKGNAAQHLTDFCKSAGLEWSIQDQQVQILQLNQPLQGQAILIDAAHGMEGSPSVDSKGVLSVETLMIPGIKPGVLITMNAIHVQGNYRVQTVETHGDTFGNDWGHKISAIKFK